MFSLPFLSSFGYAVARPEAAAKPDHIHPEGKTGAGRSEATTRVQPEHVGRVVWNGATLECQRNTCVKGAGGNTTNTIKLSIESATLTFMDQIEEFGDERQKSWCIHCGEWLGTVDINRDHVPSRNLLLKPYPKNLPIVQVCKPCNESFSLDEEYFTTFLSCVLSGTTDPEDQQNPRAGRALKRRTKLKMRIEHAKKEEKSLDGETRTVWNPEVERMNRVILKNARGHAFYEYSEPMLAKPESVWAIPLESLTSDERAEFENIDSGGFCPEVGSRMMTRVITGQDLSGDWVIVQDGVYKYSVVQQGVILVRSVLFEYLATQVYWSD